MRLARLEQLDNAAAFQASAHRLEQFFGIVGLEKVIVDTQGASKAHIFMLRTSRQKQKRNDRTRVQATHSIEQSETIQKRHGNIGNNHVGVYFFKGIQGQLSVGIGKNLVAVQFQNGAGHQAQRIFIFGKQYFCHHSPFLYN
jgi:hypothetical protein